MNKWQNLKFEKVYIVEPNEQNLEELERRKEQMTRGESLVDMEICRNETTGELLGFEDTAELNNIVAKGKSLDGIVTFFSLTFFGRDQERWDAMLDSFDTLLENGGKVVGIVMDGERTKTLLEEDRKKNNISDEEGAQYSNNSFMISQVSEFDEGVVGNEIEIKIFEESSMVRGEGESGGQQEWLFYFDKFVADMASRGFVLHRNGFLDTDKKERTSFDVLPPDSKVFSALNRFFVFSKKTRGSKARSNTGVVLGLLDNDEMKPFHTFTGVGSEGEDVNLYRIGTLRDPSNFIHSVVRAFDTRYYGMTVPQRKAFVKKIRGVLGRKLQKEDYETLNDGAISARHKAMAIADLAKNGNKTPSDDEVSDLGFLEYRLKVMDPVIHVSADTISELLSALLGVNIILLNGNGKIKKVIHGSRDCEYMRDVFYGHPKTILLMSPDGVYYDLVAKVIEIEGDEPEVYSMFSTDDNIIVHVLKDMCD